MARWGLPDDLHSRITSGPLCPFHDHAVGSLDGLIPRYDDSHACVRCIGALTEGRLELNVRRIHPQFRRRFLEFWSFVDIAHTSDCWIWRGPVHRSTQSSYFPFPRHWSDAGQYSAPRIATWLTWGDIGRLPIQPVCEDKLCCNPLHIRVLGVPHFHHNRRLATIELNATARQLVADTTEFLQVTREQAPARFRRIEKLSADWIRLRAEAGEPLPPELIQQGGLFDGS